MDPFNQMNQQNNPRVIVSKPNPSFIDLSTHSPGYLDDEKPSWTEKVLGKAVGTLTKLITFIVLGVGITALIILLRPFMKLIIEFSNWAYNSIDKFF